MLALLLPINFLFAEEDHPLDLEPIVISKSRIHLLNSYFLEFDSLKNFPLTSPLENLNLLPLDLQSRSPQQDIQTDFSLRGSTFQGVLILIDGQRINDPQTAHHNCDIPLTREDIQGIEVIPGLGSSLFGPDAIGGAINVKVKKPKDKKMILTLGAGSYQTKSGTFSITEKRDDLGIRFSLERQESDGFSYDTDFKKFISRLDSSLDLPCGEFNLGLGYQEKEFGAYDFYTPGLGYPSKEWTKTYLLNTAINLDGLGDFIIRPNFLWHRHYDKFMLDKTQIRSLYLNHHYTDVYTPTFYLQKDSESFGKIGLGIEYGEEKIRSTNLGKHTRSHKSLFIDESKDITSRYSLGLSFRRDDFQGFDSSYTATFNLKFNYSDKDSLNLSIGNSIRIPSFTELYYNDPTTQGDPSLCEEKTLNYQIGYDYKKEGISSGIAFFLRQEKDMLDWIKLNPTQAKWQIENITEAEVKGIESHLELKINPNCFWKTYYTYVDKRIHDQGYLYKYGPNYIRHLVTNSLVLDLPFGSQIISATYKKRSVRDGWFLLNTHLSYKFHKSSETFLNITNLLNVEYQDIVGIAQPGRWIEAGMRFEW